MKLPRLTRDGLLFTVGLVGLIFEIFISARADPAAMTALTAVLLSPLVLRADEARRNGK